MIGMQVSRRPSYVVVTKVCVWDLRSAWDRPSRGTTHDPEATRYIGPSRRGDPRCYATSLGNFLERPYFNQMVEMVEGEGNNKPPLKCISVSKVWGFTHNNWYNWTNSALVEMVDDFTGLGGVPPASLPAREGRFAR